VFEWINLETSQLLTQASACCASN